MPKSTAVTVRTRSAGTPDEFISKWGDNKAFFADLIRTGFLPDSIKSPEQAMSIVLAGKELGIPVMTALRKIHIIKGVPTVAPELMLAMIRRSGQLKAIKWVDDGKMCTVTMKRKGEAEVSESFSMADAEAMKTKEDNQIIPLSQKFNWRTMPKVMRRWRATAACARLVFPDIIGGLYITEEIENSDVEDQSFSMIGDGTKEPIKLAEGVSAKEFDPLVETIERGNYAGMTWMELPEDYLLHVKKKGASSILRWKAEVTLNIREAASKELVAQQGASPIDEAFPDVKKELIPITPEVPLIDVLLSELADVARSAKRDVVVAWAEANKERIAGLSPEKKAELNEAYKSELQTIKNRKGKS